MRLPKNLFKADIILALTGVLLGGQITLCPGIGYAQFDLLECWDMCEDVYGECLNLCPIEPYPPEFPCESDCFGSLFQCYIDCIPEPPPPPEQGYFVWGLTEIVQYSQYTDILVSFGRYYIDDFLIDPGTVEHVDIYYISLADYNPSVDFYENNFAFAGNAEFNSNKGSWDYGMTFAKMNFGPKYIIRADFHDPGVPDGLISGYVLALPATKPIPTLSEWGLIIFGVLLAAWMAWMIMRRRKKVEVSI